MVKHWGDDGVLSGFVSEETNLSEVTWDTEMLIQCHANHAVEYGVSGFFPKNACHPHLSVYVSVFLSIWSLQALVLEKTISIFLTAWKDVKACD